MKLLPVIALMMLPAVAAAEYDAGAIKKGITESKQAFQVTGWKKTKKGDGWLADTKLKNSVIAVTGKNASLFETIASSTEAIGAMIRCMELGQIGTGADSEKERAKISDVVAEATQSQSTKATEVNGVQFEVTPKEVMGNVVLTCVLS